MISLRASASAVQRSNHCPARAERTSVRPELGERSE